MTRTHEQQLAADIATFAKIAKEAGLNEMPTDELRLLAFVAFHCYVRRLRDEETSTGDTGEPLVSPQPGHVP